MGVTLDPPPQFATYASYKLVRLDSHSIDQNKTRKKFLNPRTTPSDGSVMVRVFMGGLFAKGTAFRNFRRILQPMDQGVISTFKKHNMKKCMSQLMEATRDHKNTFETFWKSYYVKDAIDNVAKSLREATT